MSQNGDRSRSPRRSTDDECSPTQRQLSPRHSEARHSQDSVPPTQVVESSNSEVAVEECMAGVDAVLLQYAEPLLQQLRGPQEDWPAMEDFLRIPAWPSDARPRPFAQCLHEIESLGAEKEDLDKAGSRLVPDCCNSLPVQVALFCLCHCSGFPEKLVQQVWSTMLCACLHRDLQVQLKGNLTVAPRLPSIGIAAPGSKKTPVQQEMIHRIFCQVIEKFTFLHYDSEVDGERLLFDGGSTAGFLKQLKQNHGYVYLVVEELVSFFDPSYANTGNTNTGQHIAPSTLLPLRTGNGLSKALSSDLNNRIDRTQAAMSMMAQEDVIRKFFLREGNVGLSAILLGLESFHVR